MDNELIKQLQEVKLQEDRMVIRDMAGRPFAQLVTSNDITTIYDMANRAFGKYDKRTDTTMDMAGRSISRGNTLTVLLPEPRRM